MISCLYALLQHISMLWAHAHDVIEIQILRGYSEGIVTLTEMATQICSDCISPHYVNIYPLQPQD